MTVAPTTIEEPLFDILSSINQKVIDYLEVIRVLKEKVINPFSELFDETQMKSSKFNSVFKHILKVETATLPFQQMLNEYIVRHNPNEFVSPIFKILSEYFAIYFNYIQRYNKVYNSLAQERYSNTEENQLFTAYEDQVNMAIECVLFLPIQHLQSFPGFFESLIEHTVLHEDILALNANFSVAKSEIARMSILFNEVAEMDDMSRLEKTIEGFEVIKNGRRMFFKGECTKFSRSTKDNRLLIVFSDGLMVGNKNKFAKFYNLGEYSIRDYEDNGIFKNACDILTNGKSFRVNFDTLNLKNKILKAYKEAKTILKARWPDENNVPYAPVWIPDELVPNCMICTTKFTLFNQRHHCRKCGDCICSKCSSNRAVLPTTNGKPELICDKCFDILEKAK
ncbi:FYVE zinc finger family protein [Tritrichomonas foetus]|uniref:FYVE zinc finger family protein n=1 Tax=Tritrichomonas foetus TaxID=1144522 RepID=A0A1J4K9M7_9EUKA|nr:FYVE zinc finger family protein [Tritrichomonas foetus]|eukprot:OHT07650.1 FYVE zinc finger family protein [Tritrichomonas foetus]